MTTMIDKIIAECSGKIDMTKPAEAGDAMYDIADRILDEVNKILTQEQGSMNQQADHARWLAEDIRWKLTTDFPHLSKN